MFIFVCVLEAAYHLHLEVFVTTASGPLLKISDLCLMTSDAINHRSFNEACSAYRDIRVVVLATQTTTTVGKKDVLSVIPV